jgi:ketosteroid isomerase-like protein
MKKFIVIAIVLLTAVAALRAQTAPDAAELTRLLNEFLAGAGRSDAAVHDRFWADDLIYTRSAGVRIGKADLMKGLRSAPAPKAGDPVTVYTAEDIQIHQYGDAAIVAFRLVATTTRTTGKEISNYLNTGTFIKRNAKWQAVAWQSTAIPKPDEVKPQTSAAVQEKPQLTGAVLPNTAKPSTSSSEHTYLKGSRGGCYYLTEAGKKVYVDHSLCK